MTVYLQLVTGLTLYELEHKTHARMLVMSWLKAKESGRQRTGLDVKWSINSHKITVGGCTATDVLAIPVRCRPIYSRPGVGTGIRLRWLVILQHLRSILVCILTARD